jgi:hypothetical protein
LLCLAAVLASLGHVQSRATDSAELRFNRTLPPAPETALHPILRHYTALLHRGPAAMR